VRLPTRRRHAALLGLLCAGPIGAQQLPPVRPLGPITRVSAAGVLGSVSMVRALSTGAVIVNDVTRRQLVMFDANLVRVKVIADTSMATGKGYGAALGGLLTFHGDTSLFVDPSTLSMLVIDGQGEVARVAAVPRPKDVNSMIGGPFGTPAIDPRGRIVCRNLVPPKALVMDRTGRGRSNLSVQTDDSALIYRIDLGTRAVDTVAWVKVPVDRRTMSEGANGGLRVLERTNPLPVVDDWALMPDGRVAVVRGADLHIDWVDLDGHMTSTPKMPFPWERLSDEAKERFLDSLNVERERRREAVQKAIRNNSAMPPTSVGGNDNPLRRLIVTGQLVGDISREPRPQTQVVLEYLKAKELPDYRPAFALGATRADPDGNLWVRTTTPSSAGAIYHVIDGEGRLVERVRVPFGRVISGFGPGVVYLGVLDEKGARLERARIR